MRFFYWTQAWLLLGVTLGCSLPSVTLGAQVAWASGHTRGSADAPARASARVSSVAWVAIGVALERSQHHAAGEAVNAQPATRDEADRAGELDTTVPCALTLACDWEDEQRALELATWTALTPEDGGELLP